MAIKKLPSFQDPALHALAQVLRDTNYNRLGKADALRSMVWSINFDIDIRITACEREPEMVLAMSGDGYATQSVQVSRGTGGIPPLCNVFSAAPGLPPTIKFAGLLPVGKDRTALLRLAVDEGKLKAAEDPVAFIDERGHPFGLLELTLLRGGYLSSIVADAKALGIGPEALQGIVDRLEARMVASSIDATTFGHPQLLAGLCHSVAELAPLSAQPSAELWNPVVESLKLAHQHTLLDMVLCDRSAVDLVQVSALLDAGFKCHDLVHQGCWRRHVDLVRLALMRDHDPEQLDAQGKTPPQAMAPHATTSDAGRSIVAMLSAACARKQAREVLTQIASDRFDAEAPSP